MPALKAAPAPFLDAQGWETAYFPASWVLGCLQGINEPSNCVQSPTDLRRGLRTRRKVPLERLILAECVRRVAGTVSYQISSKLRNPYIVMWITSYGMSLVMSAFLSYDILI
jgi:hypothetical protein